MATPVWESVKENAAPLMRGRRVEDLENHEHNNEENLRIVAEFEKRVTDANNNEEEDPLIDWLRYIKFHQNHFPSHTHEQFLLLERCFRSLYDTRKYNDDPRFIRVCCMYADKTVTPSTTFLDLYKLGIGHSSATFYNAWAYVAEREENFRLAEQIFAKGIRKNAQPLPYLLQRQKHFQRRMSRYFLNLTAAGEETLEEEEDEMISRRGVLGSLSDMAVRRNDRSRNNRSSSRQTTATWNASSSSTFRDRTATPSLLSTSTNTNTNNNNDKNGFSIFVESNNDVENNGGILESSFEIAIDRRQPETQAEIYKENRARAERWNERNNEGFHNNLNNYYSQRTTINPTSFAIHVDEECAIQHDREEAERRNHERNQRLARDERFVLQTSETSVADKLMQDPLRYVRDPQMLESDHRTTAHPLESHSSSQDGHRKTRAPAVWKNRLLKGADKSEQNFEQARLTAQYFTLGNASTNYNAMVVYEHDGDDDASRMLIDTSMQELLSESETFETLPSPIRRRQAFAPRSDLKSGKPPTSRPPERHVLVAPLSNLARADNGNNCRSNQDTSTSYDHPTPRNASTASSTVDEAVAVGVVGGKEEQTINTKLAVQELSMMFSSPAMGLNESGILNRSGGLGPILNQNTNQSFNTIAEADDDPDGSFAAESPLVHEAQPSFVLKNKSLKGNASEESPNVLSHDCSDGPRFTIFDEAEEKRVRSDACDFPGNSIMSHNGHPPSSKTTANTSRQSQIPIFEDNSRLEKQNDNWSEQEDARSTPNLLFQIYDESSESGVYNNGDTMPLNEAHCNSNSFVAPNRTQPSEHLQFGRESDAESSSNSETVTLSILQEICKANRNEN